MKECKPLEHIPPDNCPLNWKYADSLEIRCKRCDQLIPVPEFREYIEAVK